MYKFKEIQTIPPAKQLVDIVLSRTQRKTPTVVHPGFKITRVRAFYMRKVKFCQTTYSEKFQKILEDFPKIDDIHPFYADLCNVLYDRDHYKLALGQLSTARTLIDNVWFASEGPALMFRATDAVIQNNGFYWNDWSGTHGSVTHGTAEQARVCVNRFRYAQSATGSTACPDRTVGLESEEACQAAAEAFGLSYGSASEDANRPAGCNYQGSSVYWNTHDTGAAHSQRRCALQI